MAMSEPSYRLYEDLADWWPLISPVGEYAADAEDLARVLVSEAAGPVREVLDLGGGGGHLAAHLKRRFALTVVDVSARMLAASRVLNPECEHARGDMRSVRLGRVFDAVLVHDAASYLVTEDEVRQTAATAFSHCRPGGVAVFAPDWTQETFRPGASAGGSWDVPAGDAGGQDDGGLRAARRARFAERRWDPAPGDGWVRADYEFTLRAAGGSVRVVRESHRLGALRRAAWLRALSGAGFACARAERGGRDVFVARRPDAVPGL